MPYRTVTNARKLASRLAGHSRKHGERVADSATRPYHRLIPDGRRYLDLYEYQIALGETVDEMRQELAAIDDRHARELQSVRNLRELRDAAVADLRESLFQLKQTLEGYFGPGGSHKIFDESPAVPNDPEMLHQLAERIHHNLTNPEFPMPEPTQDGVVVSPRVLASSFEDPRIRLGQFLVWLHDSESESKHTQSSKDAAVEQLEKLNGKVARFFESFYDVAGHERLASRLRRSSRRRSGGSEPESGDEAEPSAEPSEAPVPSSAEESAESAFVTSSMSVPSP